VQGAPERPPDPPLLPLMLLMPQLVSVTLKVGIQLLHRNFQDFSIDRRHQRCTEIAGL